MSERPPQIAELARRIQTLRVPERSRAAIQAAVEQRLERRARTRGWVLAAAVVLFAPAAVAALRWWSASTEAPPAQTHPEQARQPTGTSHPPAPTRLPAVAPVASVRDDAPASTPARPRPRRRARAAQRPAPESPSDLAQQVAAFRQALELLGVDDRAALAHWRAMAARWPQGALRPEVDLRIVEALVRLGKKREARREAAAFFRRHPKSPAARQMRALVEKSDGR